MVTFSFDLVGLVRTMKGPQSASLYLVWRRSKRSTSDTSSRGKKIQRQRLGGFEETIRPPRAQLAVINGVTVRLDVTVPGNLALRFDEDPGTGIGLRTDAITRREGITELECEVTTHNRALMRATTVVYGRLSRTRIEIDAAFSVNDVRSQASSGKLRYRVTPRLDVSALAAQLPGTDDILDVWIELEVENFEEPFRRRFRSRSIQDHKLKSTVTKSGPLTHLFIPYLTYRTHALAFRIEVFPTENYRYLRRLLRISWLFPLAKPFTRIWLIGEVPYKAQDNGMHFFRYVRTEHPRRRAYYVIDGASADRQQLLPLGNVVDRFSRRHLLYSLLASRLICSHHSEYLFASRDRRVAARTRGVRIFLQHGITAAKNVTPIYARQRTYELPAERFIVASDLERRIVEEDYGYRPSQVPVVGFARFDALFSKAGPVARTILVMPTWREAIRAETFLDSDYFRNWHGFLTDPRLQQILEEHDLQITMVLHPNMRTFADFFAVPNVRLIRQEDVDVQEHIKSSAVLVTDFSSVAWDFSFLRRPVLYFQFDQQMLVGSRAPHIDFTEQLPGPIATTVDRLISELSAIVDRDCKMDDGYWSRAQAFVKYRDQHNCERIYDVVRHSWGPSTILNRVRNARAVQRRWWTFRRAPNY